MTVVPIQGEKGKKAFKPIPLKNPLGLTLDSEGNIYFCDYNNRIIRKLITSTGELQLPNGIKNSKISNPAGVMLDKDGNLYFSDWSDQTVKRLDVKGQTLIAAGIPGSYGKQDGTDSRLNGPFGITMDKDGFIYVCDTGNHSIRKVDRKGYVTTLAGTAGKPGFRDGKGPKARFNLPKGITCDKDGNIFVCDSGNHTVRKIDPTGVVTTVAGVAGKNGAVDGPALEAKFNELRGIAVDDQGNLFVCDSGNHTVRRITPAGKVQTVAGVNGRKGNIEGRGNTARLSAPYGITIDKQTGVMYVTEWDSHLIKKLVPENTMIYKAIREADWELVENLLHHYLRQLPLETELNNQFSLNAILFAGKVFKNRLEELKEKLTVTIPLFGETLIQIDQQMIDAQNERDQKRKMIEQLQREVAELDTMEKKLIEHTRTVLIQQANSEDDLECVKKKMVETDQMVDRTETKMKVWSDILKDKPLDTWTPQEVSFLLQEFGLQFYAPIFENKKITGAQLLQLTTSRLRNELGMSYNEAKRTQRAVQLVLVKADLYQPLKGIQTWHSGEVVDWLIAHKLTGCVEPFRANEVSGETLSYLSTIDLNEMGIETIEQARLLEAVQHTSRDLEAKHLQDQEEKKKKKTLMEKLTVDNITHNMDKMASKLKIDKIAEKTDKVAADMKEKINEVIQPSKIGKSITGFFTEVSHQAEKLTQGALNSLHTDHAKLAPSSMPNVAGPSELDHSGLQRIADVRDQSVKSTTPASQPTTTVVPEPQVQQQVQHQPQVEPIVHQQLEPAPHAFANPEQPFRAEVTQSGTVPSTGSSSSTPVVSREQQVPQQQAPQHVVAAPQQVEQPTVTQPVQQQPIVTPTPLVEQRIEPTQQQPIVTQPIQQQPIVVPTPQLVDAPVPHPAIQQPIESVSQQPQVHVPEPIVPPKVEPVVQQQVEVQPEQTVASQAEPMPQQPQVESHPAVNAEPLPQVALPVVNTEATVQHDSEEPTVQRDNEDPTVQHHDGDTGEPVDEPPRQSFFSVTIDDDEPHMPVTPVKTFNENDDDDDHYQHDSTKSTPDSMFSVTII